jgi:methylase of polypeptide subunit release factors
MGICHGVKSGQEENIKVKVVLPVLRALGWKEDDMDFEHHVGNKRADIALMVGRLPKVIVETKSHEKSLDAYKTQTLGYAQKKGITWALLTNGNDWQLYRSFIEDVEDRRNRPVFEFKLQHIKTSFLEFEQLIGHKHIANLDVITKPRIEAIRKAITQEDLLETLRQGKQILFSDLLHQFGDKYANDKAFRLKIDQWVEEHKIDKTRNWLDEYDHDKIFRDRVNQILELDKKIDEAWQARYNKDGLFKNGVDKILRENDIQIDWIDQLCSRGAYAFINRVLFLRICEDRGYIEIRSTQEWMSTLRKTAFGPTVIALLKELFADASKRFSIYSEPLFDHIMIEELDWSKDTVLHIIERSKKHDFKRIDRDILGPVYEKHLTRETRRSLGQFYTPPPIIDHILRQIPLDEKNAVLDPACGSGGFLLGCYDLLKAKMLKTGWSEDEAHEYIVSRILHGIDIDSFAVQLTQMNLLFKDLNRAVDVANVIEGDSIAVGLNLYAENAAKSESLGSASYGAVVSNPPFVNIPKDHPRYKFYFGDYYSDIIAGPINSSSLFLKRSVDMLQEGGWIGFVIPKSLLRVDSYRAIRQYLMKKCRVKSITDIGRGFEEVGYEVVTFVAQKTADEQKRLTNTIEIYTDIENLETRSYQRHLAEQAFFAEEGLFLIYVTEEVQPIYEKMRSDDCIRLGGSNGIAEIWRGLGVSVKSSLISSKKTKPTDMKCLQGESIGRYVNKTSPVLWLHEEALRSYEVPVNRLKRKKIVAQNIVTSRVRRVATYDDEALVNIDTITNVSVKDERFNEKYVLAILNSKLMTWYIRDVVFNRAELTMHMDDPYLGQLPIKLIPKKKQQPFVRIVDKLLDLRKILGRTEYTLFTHAEYNKAVKESTRLNAELDERVFDLYGLSKEERESIKHLVPYT